jgi:hypothetical protein
LAARRLRRIFFFRHFHRWFPFFFQTRDDLFIGGTSREKR